MIQNDVVQVGWECDVARQNQSPSTSLLQGAQQAREVIDTLWLGQNHDITCFCLYTCPWPACTLSVAPVSPSLVGSTTCSHCHSYTIMVPHHVCSNLEVFVLLYWLLVLYIVWLWGIPAMHQWTFQDHEGCHVMKQVNAAIIGAGLLRNL